MTVEIKSNSYVFRILVEVELDRWTKNRICQLELAYLHFLDYNDRHQPI